MDKTASLGQTIDSRLKDSHGRCETLSSETLTQSCWLVCVINRSHNSDSVLVLDLLLDFYSGSQILPSDTPAFMVG